MPFKILFKNEFKQNLKSLIWWSLIISAVMFLVISMFSSMTDFQTMMDSLPEAMRDIMNTLSGGDMTSITGLYVMESSETLLLAGSIFAGLLGISLINRNINAGSSEFLYSLPASRKSIWRSKFAVLLGQIFLFDLIISLTSLIGMFIFSTGINVGAYFAYFGLVLSLHLQIGIICFGLASAFKTKVNSGAAMAIVFVLFVFNIVLAVVEEASFLKYITPFAYVNGAVMNLGISVILPLHKKAC